MNKTATINSRISPVLKKETEKIFYQLGISTSEAITLFFTQVTLAKGLPFEIKIPNKETREAIEELENEKGVKCKNIDDFFEKVECK